MYKKKDFCLVIEFSVVVIDRRFVVRTSSVITFDGCFFFKPLNCNLHDNEQFIKVLEPDYVGSNKFLNCWKFTTNF